MALSDTTRFALALDAMDGVGRVTAGRLLSHFTGYDDLLRYPREQVLARIKGVPRSKALVAALFDRETMDTLLEKAGQTMEGLRKQRVTLVTMRDAAWPTGLNALPRGNRPFMLHAYGRLDVLRRPIVAVLARPPLTTASVERVRALVGHLVRHDAVPATGTAPALDEAVHKLCYGGTTGYPSLLIASAGMTKTPSAMRPTISAVAHAGGLFLSPFAMEHGPYDHDDKERALVLAALAGACVFFEPTPHTPEWHALTWAAEAGRPVFGVAAPQHPLPERVHPLHSDVDVDWVLAAVRTGS